MNIYGVMQKIFGRKGERGSVLTVTALLMVPLLGSVGVVVDGSRIYAEYRKAQNAADAAAWAGAHDLALGRGATQAVATATYYATQNGFTTGSGKTVTVNSPPATGSFAGNANYIQVRITNNFPTFIAKALTRSQFTVQTSATAGITSGGAGGGAIYVLNPSVCRSLTLNGSGNWILQNGSSVQVNSSCASDAGRKVGSGNMTLTGGGFINVVGGWSQVGSGTVSPAAQSGRLPIQDPLASLPEPAIVGTIQNGTAASPTAKKITGSTNVTLNPGIYYGGINISGSGNITLNPGTYILAGGGLDVTGSGNFTGNNVFIYNTNDPMQPTGAGAYGTIRFAGSGNINLTQSNSGTYAGMSFFQARANTQPATFSGSGNLLAGTMYFKNAAMTFNGSGNVSSNFQLIVDTLTMNGSGNLTNVFNTAQLYQGVMSAALVE